MTKETHIPELGITIKELDTPSAAVSKHLALSVGLNFRAVKEVKKTKNTVDVILELVIPQNCHLCGARKKARVIENAGVVRVKRVNNEWRVVSVKFTDRPEINKFQ